MVKAFILHPKSIDIAPQLHSFCNTTEKQFYLKTNKISFKKMHTPYIGVHLFCFNSLIML